MHDYDDLIIISYKGGYGGDLVSTMIDQNFNYKRKINLLSGPQLNRFNYTQGQLNGFKGLNGVLRYLYKCLHRDVNDVNEEMGYLYKIFNLGEIHNFCWDISPDQIMENLIEYFRYKYDCLRDKPKVINTHYTEKPPGPFSNFTVDQIFPGSTKIRLACEPKYVDFFNALCFYKLDQIIIEPNERLDRSAVTLDDLNDPNRHEYLKNNFEDFVDVDVGKLFFEDDVWVDKIEAQLSDIIGSRIALDKDFICSTYKPRNFEIIEHIFGPNYMSNSIDTNLEKFLDYAKAKQR